MKIRIAIITNILPPYRIPLFNILYNIEGVSLKVYLCADTEPNRQWDWSDDIIFSYEIIRTIKLCILDKTVYLPLQFSAQLEDFQPDVVIAGSYGLISLIALHAARKNNAKFIIWGEGKPGADGTFGKIAAPLRKYLFSHCDWTIPSSASAKRLFISYGAYPKRMTASLITFDTSAFRASIQKTDREKLKKDLGLTGKVILYVGRIVLKKGIDLLLESYVEVKRAWQCSLVIIGGDISDGERISPEFAHTDGVHWLGFKQARDLPKFYSIADLFVLLSREERFGLVISEAITAGLPIVSSRYVGANDDLLIDGQNGFIVDPEDIKQVAHKIVLILQHDKLRHRMRNAALRMSAKCDIQESAKRMHQAACASLQVGKL